MFSSVQSLSWVRLFATPWIAACQASLSITNPRGLLKPMSIKSVMPSNHLIPCRPLLLLLPIPPSIRVFSNESAHLMKWPNICRGYLGIYLCDFNTTSVKELGSDIFLAFVSSQPIQLSWIYAASFSLVPWLPSLRKHSLYRPPALDPSTLNSVSHWDFSLWLFMSCFSANCNLVCLQQQVIDSSK